MVLDRLGDTSTYLRAQETTRLAALSTRDLDPPLLAIAHKEVGAGGAALAPPYRSSTAHGWWSNLPVLVLTLKCAQALVERGTALPPNRGEAMALPADAIVLSADDVADLSF
jgi:hypothetical protein